MNHQSLSAFIWSVADLLRGDYKQSEYGRTILPFTVLRRLDCVLEPTKEAVLEAAGKGKPDPILLRASGNTFFNRSPLDLVKLIGDQDNIATNLLSYVQGFSPEVRDIFEQFEFAAQIDRLAKNGLLYQVTERFAGIDLHPDRVDNNQMGQVFEELIRRFAEISNETAGEHFTPREVIRLMVNLIFVEDDHVLSKPSVVRTIYDPTAGTGGMLSIAGEYLHEHNPQAHLTMSGQELNPESYAICKADMLIKGQDIKKIVQGNTLSDDGHPHEKFDYMLSKMRTKAEGGCRFGIVLNGSPLFTGAAGSGESEIRRYVLENDLVEAIIALPTDMFYNTGIATYVWVLSNKKPAERKGKVQLIDASSFWQKMRKSLGSKRKQMSEDQIDEVTQMFGAFVEAEVATVLDADGKEVSRHVVSEGEAAPAAPEGGKVKVAPLSRIFDNQSFGYQTITVERPQLDEHTENYAANIFCAVSRTMPFFITARRI